MGADPDVGRLRRTVMYVLTRLVAGRYEELVSAEPYSMSAPQMRAALAEWPFTVTMPPTDLPPPAPVLGVIPIRGTDPQEWHVDVDLWTAEEGRSDLTLQLRLLDGTGDRYACWVYALHVL